MGLWWTLAYGGADLLTQQHGFRVRLHLDADLHIPFVPETVLFYLSVNLLFPLAPFILRTRREVNALAATLATVILCAGVGFVLFPADSGFLLPESTGSWTGLVEFTRWIALQHNMAPSLHVALAVTCAAVFAACAGLVGKVLFWAWGLAICASTLLLRQHYLVDVGTGLLLAGAAVRWGYARWARAPEVCKP